MRWMPGIVLAATALAGAASADEQKVLYTAAVVADEAEIRSGAGNTPQMYATARLRRGEMVEVLREADGGWLGIRPPAGSFSWINTRFVKEVSTGRWVVVAHPDVKVPLLVGSTLKAEKPTVEGAKVSRGTLLKSIGPAKLSEDGYWLPVETSAKEVRWIRAEQVARKPGERTVVAAPPPPGGQVDPPGPPDPVGAAPQGTDVNAMWQRAQQAEQGGHYNEAIQLYRDLASKTATSNHAMSVQASNRAQWLTDSLQARQPAAPARTASAASDVPAGMSRSGPGWLRRLGRSDGVNVLYILENTQSRPIVYAVAMPGHTLAPYENHSVDLIGTSVYRNDLRANLMTVYKVQPLQ